jgi:N6-adenosine-specific RNA methylase IME4/DNA-binding CsgD family transcriptional regulator
VKYQVLPDLTPIEFESLKADIAERGVLVPVEVDEDGEILDGHHRLRAWRELRAEGCIVPDYPRMIRRGLSEEQKRNHARSLNVLRRHLSKEQREQVAIDMANDGMSRRQIAEAIGVTHPTVSAILENSGGKYLPPETVKGSDGKQYPAQPRQRTEHSFNTSSMFVPGGSVAIEPKAATEAAKQIQQERTAERRQERVEKINEIAKGDAPLEGLTQTYPVIYADPPWRYEHARTENRAIENHYPTMTIEEICALPVNKIAADDAVLFLWATSPKLEESMRVISAWGFIYRTSIVWDKEIMGPGYYARQQHELLLIAKRGNPPMPKEEDRIRSVVRIRRSSEHSEKPCEFYEIIERMYPEFDRLEMFARTQRPGWAAWGNQA